MNRCNQTNQRSCRICFGRSKSAVSKLTKSQPSLHRPSDHLWIRMALGDVIQIAVVKILALGNSAEQDAAWHVQAYWLKPTKRCCLQENKEATATRSSTQAIKLVDDCWVYASKDCCQEECSRELRRARCSYCFRYQGLESHVLGEWQSVRHESYVCQSWNSSEEG
jgi:hypothetical protein